MCVTQAPQFVAPIHRFLRHILLPCQSPNEISHRECVCVTQAPQFVAPIHRFLRHVLLPCQSPIKCMCVSHKHHNCMPHFTSFFGMYCFHANLPSSVCVCHTSTTTLCPTSQASSACIASMPNWQCPIKPNHRFVCGEVLTWSKTEFEVLRA